MNQCLCILGRQPQLGLAELESLYGSQHVRQIGFDVGLVEVDPCTVAFSRLGGSIKLAKILTILDTTRWSELVEYVESVIAEHVQTVPKGKFKLGISVHGLEVTPKTISTAALGF